MDSINDSFARAGWINDLERSDCGRVEPAYRYIRRSDKLPRLEELLRLNPPTPILRVKLYLPEGHMTWYVAAYEPAHRIAWGAVDNGCEFTTGAISMPELVRLRSSRLRLPLERDLSFLPTRLTAAAAGWLVRGHFGSRP